MKTNSLKKPIYFTSSVFTFTFWAVDNSYKRKILKNYKKFRIILYTEWRWVKSTYWRWIYFFIIYYWKFLLTYHIDPGSSNDLHFFFIYNFGIPTRGQPDSPDGNHFISICDFWLEGNWEPAIFRQKSHALTYWLLQIKWLVSI